ncbi:MAG: hypothetical protein R3F49_20035 [Planctomycetota bacterium]
MTAEDAVTCGVSRETGRSTRATFCVTLVLAAALVTGDRFAVARAPSDAALARRVIEESNSATARQALFALIARETARSARIPALDSALAALGPEERAFLAAYRPDLLRRGAAK